MIVLSPKVLDALEDDKIPELPLLTDLNLNDKDVIEEVQRGKLFVLVTEYDDCPMVFVINRLQDLTELLNNKKAGSQVKLIRLLSLTQLNVIEPDINWSVIIDLTQEEINQNDNDL